MKNATLPKRSLQSEQHTTEDEDSDESIPSIDAYERKNSPAKSMTTIYESQFESHAPMVDKESHKSSVENPNKNPNFSTFFQFDNPRKKIIPATLLSEELPESLFV